MPKKNELANSEDGIALQKLLSDNGAIDMEALNALLAKKGVRGVVKGVQDEKYSRVEKKREWASADKILTADERAKVEMLPDVIGKAPAIVSEGRELTQEEIDLWAQETVVEREVTDILNGLNERRRSTFFNVSSFLNDGDPLAEHTFVSKEQGVKFTVSKSGRTGNPDYTKLEEVLDEDTWNDITDEVVTRVVDEEKLAKALEQGKVTMDQFVSLVPEKKEWRVLSVKPLKEGDDS